MSKAPKRSPVVGKGPEREPTIAALLRMSDQFAVPLCRIHHRLVHRVGNEAAWWKEVGIDPVQAASKLWKRTRLDEDNSESKHSKETAEERMSAMQARHGHSHCQARELAMVLPNKSEYITGVSIGRNVHQFPLSRFAGDALSGATIASASGTSRVLAPSCMAS